MNLKSEFIDLNSFLIFGFTYFNICIINQSSLSMIMTIDNDNFGVPFICHFHHPIFIRWLFLFSFHFIWFQFHFHPFCFPSICSHVFISWIYYLTCSIHFCCCSFCVVVTLTLLYVVAVMCCCWCCWWNIVYSMNNTMKCIETHTKTNIKSYIIMIQMTLIHLMRV